MSRADESIFRRLMSDRGARVAVGVIILLCLAAVIGPSLSPYSPEAQLDKIGRAHV